MRSTISRRVVLAVVALLPACADDDPTPEPEVEARAAESTSTTVAHVVVSAIPDRGVVVGSGEEWLAYQEPVAGLEQIFLIRPDGSGRHQLAPDVEGGHQTNPDWSPDGAQLVFAVGNGSTDDLWVIGADGSNARLLVECVEPCVAVDDPAWSPDGEAVLFSRLAVGPTGTTAASLESVDIQSGAVTVLLTAPEPDFIAGQRISPDGSTVVLEWVHTDGSAPFEQVTGVELAVVDLGASAPTMRAITDASSFAATADWSPDGSTIVYSALPTADAAAPELFSIRPDGTGQTQLTSVGAGGGSAEHPDYTPDGNGVVFAGSVDGRGPLLMILRLNDGEITPAAGTIDVEGVHPRSRPVHR